MWVRNGVVDRSVGGARRIVSLAIIRFPPSWARSGPGASGPGFIGECAPKSTQSGKGRGVWGRITNLCLQPSLFIPSPATLHW